MNSTLLFSKIIYGILLILFIIVVILVIASLISNFFIDTTQYIITSKKIPVEFDGYKILQLSDLHNFSFGKNNNRLLKEIEEINPDIIVMTGDMVNSNSKKYDVFYSLAENISKKYTVYYIMGNHEMRLTKKQQKDIFSKLKSFGINVLDNDQTIISKGTETIKLYGLHQPITSYKNALKNDNETDFTLEQLKQTLPNINSENFNILLSHSPFDFETFEKWGADLVLSGHVHGGLIRLPFIGGILSPERTLFPKYDAGEFSINNSKMIVNRGLGNGTINLRFFNNPEVCVIKLEHKKN